MHMHNNRVSDHRGATHEKHGDFIIPRYTIE